MTNKIILVLLVTALSAAQLPAQKRRTVKKKPTTITSPATVAPEKARARRTGLPVQTPEAQPTDATETKIDPTTTTPAEKPAEPSSSTAEQPKVETKQLEDPQPAAETKDPLTTLRDQIDAADGAERNRLRLQLVEELVNTGKRSEALTELRSIVGTDVFDPQGFYNAGNSFARLGEVEDAVAAYRKAIEQRKGRYSRAFNNLGVVLLRAGRWDESYDALSSALKLESFRYPEASYNLGRLYAARGENDLAVREWRRVLALNPNHTAAADALAHVRTEERVVVEISRPTTPKTNPTTSPTAKSVATEKNTARKPAASLAPGPRSLVLDSTSFELLQRARNSAEKGNTVDAIDSYKRLLLRESGYFPPANLELSFAFLSSKRYDEAFANLQMVAARDGNRYPISYYHLARVYEMKGDLKQAEEGFSQAAQAFGNSNLQFLLDVSRVREKQGNFKGALESMERYLSLMQQQGREPSWSNDRLTALREKVGSAPKN